MTPIQQYLIDNPINRKQSFPYREAALKFKVSEERIRGIWRRLRDAGLVERKGTALSRPQIQQEQTRKVVKEFPTEIRSDEELIAALNIDTNIWAIDKWEVTKRDIKSTTEENKFIPSYQVSANFIAKKEKNSFQDLKAEILAELTKQVPKVPLLPRNNEGIKYAFEISLFDVHFGKMAWSEESGEDYDLKIAETRYKNAIEKLLGYIVPEDIERIIFPIGNDMINIDSRRNDTFSGTPQDSDSRFFKIIKTVKRVLIETLDKLSQIAPVDVIIVSGNHDPESMFMIGEILDAYYHNNENITVNNSPKQRKYYQYGKNGFQYTHGNEEKHGELGLIFATEQAKLWADTEFRFCKLGHFHKNKKISYVSVDEFQGYQVQILPSLSGSDAWHSSKGYMSKKQGKAFLYHKTEGQIAELTFNI